MNGLFEWVNAYETLNAKDSYTNISSLPYNNEILSFESIVDNEDLVLNVTSNGNLPPTPTNLTLSLSSDNINFSDNITLTANLTDDLGKGIDSANVTFSINGDRSNNVNVTTDSDGIATYIFTPDHVGEYNIIDSFKGNDDYHGSISMSKTLIVNDGSGWWTRVLQVLIFYLILKFLLILDFKDSKSTSNSFLFMFLSNFLNTIFLYLLVVLLVVMKSNYII